MKKTLGAEVQGRGRIWRHAGLASLLLFAVTACGGGAGDSSGSNASSASAQSVTADMTISWDSPNTTVDQSCLQNLSGYRVYVGLSSGVYSTSVAVPVGEASCSSSGQSNSCGAIQTCTYALRGVSGWRGGTWHFALTAYDEDGNESAYSTEASYAIN